MKKHDYLRVGQYSQPLASTMVAGLAIALLTLSFVIAPASGGDTARLSKPPAVVQGISCFTSSICEAAGGDGDDQGVVEAVEKGVPQVPVDVSNSWYLDDVSCPSATFCMASGTSGDSGFDNGYLQPYNMATTAQGVVVPIHRGVPSTAVNIEGSNEFQGIDCPTTTFCIAAGYASSFTQGATTTTTTMTTTTTTILAGQPPSVGVVVPIRNGVPGSPETVPGTLAFVGVTCSSATNCEAVGANSSGSEGAIVPITHGVPGAVTLVAGTQWLDGIACVNERICEIVGGSTGGSTGVPSKGVVFQLTEGVAGAVRQVSLGLNGISCPSTRLCEAVGGDPQGSGYAVPIIGGVPGALALVPRIGSYGVQGINCPTTTGCEVVGTNASATLGEIVKIPVKL